MSTFTPCRPAEHVLLRHLAILEHELAGVGAAHAELVELLVGREALHALLDQEGRDAARAGLRIGLGVDHEGLGDGPLVIHILLPLST
jgi:hypothetical protein